ncbi:hypothetical protein AU188_20940 [Mycobacterium sp. IS-3022]|nr:hypothetical protein AU188_20940 [Mycobacterium sp. IS-3022]
MGVVRNVFDLHTRHGAIMAPLCQCGGGFIKELDRIIQAPVTSFLQAPCHESAFRQRAFAQYTPGSRLL